MLVVKKLVPSFSSAHTLLRRRDWQSGGFGLRLFLARPSNVKIQDGVLQGYNKAISV